MKALLKKVVIALPSWAAFSVETAYFFVRQRIGYDLLPKAKVIVKTDDSRLRDLLRQVSEYGYAVVPRFKDPEWCAVARSELYQAIADADKATRFNEDDRVFGIENISSKAAEFAFDPFLLDAASVHAKANEKLLFCMANRVVFKDGTEYGSGGEWHRDGFRREMKAMLYLTDVSDSDGPFSIIRRSHRLPQIVRDTKYFAKKIKHKEMTGVGCMRLKNAGDQLDSIAPGRLVKFAAAAGTLILFDTSTVHAGQAPLRNGKERLALTNYYCFDPMTKRSLAYYRQFVKINE